MKKHRKWLVMGLLCGLLLGLAGGVKLGGFLWWRYYAPIDASFLISTHLEVLRGLTLGNPEGAAVFEGELVGVVIYTLDGYLQKPWIHKTAREQGEQVMRKTFQYLVHVNPVLLEDIRFQTKAYPGEYAQQWDAILARWVPEAEANPDPKIWNAPFPERVESKQKWRKEQLKTIETSD